MHLRVPHRLALSCLTAWTGQAGAHADGPMAPHDLWHSWNLDPWLLLLLGVTFGLYFAGLGRLWMQAGRRRGIAGRQVACHLAGMALLVVALLSPLDPLGETLASAHMAQHMLLILAAPFLVLSAPLPVWLWAFPPSGRKALARGANRRWLAWPWRYITKPTVAWALYALALWAWHAPALYQAALDVDWVHDLEHASFLFTSCLLWWVVLRAGPRASAVVLLFTTMLHGGLLAALMSFAPSPWYPAYQNTTAAWGLTPLEDQQLAGLIMWVPGGLGYLVATLAVLMLWLRRLELRPAPRPVADQNPSIPESVNTPL